MLELIERSGGEATIGFGGDTLNTAVYLARLGVPVAYATALGDDPHSAGMRSAWAREGVALDAVLTAPGGVPGLYAVHVDAQGERRFTYWREQAPVRRLFDWPGVDALERAVCEAGLVYFSGITLMVLQSPHRDRLFERLVDAKARGATIAFDSNYRPRGWASSAEAATTMDRFARLADVVLPSLDDERGLRGDVDADPVADHYLALGATEVIVKQAAGGALVATRAARMHSPAETVPRVVDSTAAGDAFNAGYLAARRRGDGPEAAARHGAALAARVVQHRGAIVPREALAGLEGVRAP
jgi:2-dehydro-3-deoxygluconokinase